MTRSGGERELQILLAALEPVLVPGEFVVVTTPDPAPIPAAAMVSEAEGFTYVLLRGDADRRSLPYDFVAGWITLQVSSALDAVGLTAAVSGELAAARISCNVLAGHFHDHLLVPHDRSREALRILQELSARYRR